MKLVKLEIANFRNLKDFKQEFSNEAKTIVFLGKNGIGKSTILDSIMWLLCDETLVYGCQNDDNLDKNDRTKPVDVTAIFVKDNGEELKLQRILTPKFTKSGEFSKYENTLKINDAEYSVKQYFARIKNDEFGIKIENDPDVSSFNTLRSILDYNYINTIKYQVAREKIEKLLKITKDDELINKPEYSIIKDELKATLYDVAKVKTKLNKQKDVIDKNLDVLNKNLDILKNAYKPIDYAELEKLENQKKQVEEMNYENSVEYKTAISKNDELNNQFKIAKDIYYKATDNYNTKLREYNKLVSLKQQEVDKIGALKEQFVSIRNSVNKCPKCNYELNGDDIRKKLDEINVKGQNSSQLIKDYDKQLEKFDTAKMEQEYKDAEKTFNATSKELESSSAKLREIISKEDTQSRIFYNEKMNKLSQINAKINEIKSQSNQSLIEQKENEIKIVRTELANIETKIEMVKDFESKKNEAISKKINEVFPNLDFRLWEESDSGAIQNTCKVYLKNVNYEGINTGHKIMVGIEVMKSLRKVLGVKESIPVIFDDLANLDKDNFEKLKAETTNQIITSYVNQNESLEAMAI